MQNDMFYLPLNFFILKENYFSVILPSHPHQSHANALSIGILRCEG